MRRTKCNRCTFFFISLALVFSIAYLSVAPSQTSATGGEVRVLSAVGMRQVILDLGPKFEHATGHKLKVRFDSGGRILKQVEQGEAADVVIINQTSIEPLSGGGRLIRGSVVDIARSEVGVAVRKGTRKPDISTPELFKRAMLEASAIACPDPALGGSSGIHIAKVFERLGIEEAVKTKLVYVSTPEQDLTMPGYVVAAGKAEIALHQMQELMAVPGIEIVGPLPGELRGTFVFSAAIMTNASDVKAAKAFIAFLRTPEASAVIKAKGMELAR